MNFFKLLNSFFRKFMNLCEGIPELILLNWILQLYFPCNSHEKLLRVKTLAALSYYTEYQLLFLHDDNFCGFVELKLLKFTLC